MVKKTVRDIDISGKRVLVRVDFNVPLDKEGKVADDTRVKAALPTIKYLTDNRAKVILMSHLGRPKGQVDDRYRLDPVAGRLAELLGKPVRKAGDSVGAAVQSLIGEMAGGDVVLLSRTARLILVSS